MALSYTISPDTGASAADRYTSGNARHQLVLSGTGTKSDTVKISYVDPATANVVTLTTTVGSGGKWSITTPTLADGTYQFTIVETTSKGAIVAQLPASATWTIDTQTSVSFLGTSGTASASSVVLTGTAEANDTVKVTYRNAKGTTVTLGTVTTDASGHWSLTTSLAAGNYSFTATATDSAGNTATATQAVSVLSGPSQTVSSILVAGDNVVNQAEAAQATMPVRVVLSAPLTSGDHLVVTLGGQNYTAVLDASDQSGKTYLASVTTAQAGGTIGAHVENALGASGATRTQSFTVDTVPPLAPTLAVHGDGGATVSLSNDNTLHVGGTAEPGSVVTVSWTNQLGITSVLGTTTAAGNGAWSLNTPALVDGTHTFSATARDAAGNVGPASTAGTVIVDTAPPAAPTLAVVDDAGASVALANDNTLHLTGIAEAGSVVTVSWTNQLGVTSALGTTTATGDGTWILDTLALADGRHSFSATARDAAGNVGPASAPGAVTVDTAPPAAPTLAVRDDGGANVALSNDNTLHIGGTAEAGSVVTVSWTDQLGVTSVLGTTTAAGNGAWSLDTPALADGTHSFSAIAHDAAGNNGPASAMGTVTVDTLAPSASVASVVIAGDNIVDSTEAQQATVPVVIKVSQALAGGELVIVTSGTATYTASLDPSDPTNTTYNVAIASPHAAGSIAVRVQDAAGNAGATATQGYTYQNAASHWDHIIVVVEENHTYSDIIGNGQAPFINGLASQGALFANFNAATNPSQPNYLIMFSGSPQGVVDDNFHFFDAPTVAGELLASGLSFAGFYETGAAQKHLPWLSFAESQSLGLNLTSFPTDFSQLPTLSFVIPNDADNMHDGSIATGDSWLQANLGAYANWAQSHNSLLIVTFDEGNSTSNRIPTIVVGAGITPQVSNQPMDHFGLLHTIESALGLPALGTSASTPVMAFSGLAPLNNAPIANGDSFYASKDAALTIGPGAGLLANDSDRDGDPLSSSLVSGPNHGSLQLNADGSFSYTPAAGYVGADSFTYRATDGKNASAVATASLYVSATPPVQLTFQQGVGGYTGVVDTMLRGSAPNTNFGNATTLVVDSDNPTGSGQSDEVLLQFTNLFGSGPKQIPFGSTIVSATLTYQTTVAGSGGDMHRMLTPWTGGSTWNSLVNGVQTDGTEAMASIDAHVAPVTKLGPGTIDVSAALQSWAGGAPNYGWVFSPLEGYDWRISSSETANGQQLSVVFIPPSGNSAPVAQGDAYSTDPNTALSVPSALGVLANDKDFDGNVLSATLVSGPSHGALQLNADGSFTYTPAAGYGGTDSFAYKANDGQADSAPATVSIGVGKLTQHTVTFQQGANGYTGTHDTMLTQSFPDAANGTAPTLVIDSDDPNGSFQWNEAILRFDNIFGTGPNQVPLGAHIISATLTTQTTDTGSGGELHRMLETWTENDTWNSLVGGIQANGVEAESAVLASTGFVSSLGPTSLGVTTSVQAWADGAANYGWAILPVGSDGWRFGSAEYSAPPSLTIVYEAYEGNHAPVGAGDSYTIAKNGILSVGPGAGVLANDSDIDGDALGAKLQGGPAHGALQFNADGSFVYTPDANYAGLDSFSYVASDGTADSAPTNVSLTVGTLTQVSVTFQQGSNGYTGAHDTMLRQDSPNTRSGTTTILNVDTDDPAGTHAWKEVLLKFDNLFGSGPNQIPLGAHIESATLSLQTTDTGSGGEFHRMLESWSENDTWNSLANGIQADGTEALAAADARTGFVGSLGQTNVDVTSSLQAWAGGAANDGWAVLPLGEDGWRFGSAEYGTPPALTVVYDVYG